MLSLLCLVASVTVIAAYPTYEPLIPNGEHVPDPCSNGTWRGVGHLSRLGGGPRNAFGIDFAAYGHKWTRDFCMADSDKDGMTNGEELGDSHCHWTPVSGHIVAATGHPGICEPVGSTQCAWQAFSC